MTTKTEAKMFGLVGVSAAASVIGIYVIYVISGPDLPSCSMSCGDAIETPLDGYILGVLVMVALILTGLLIFMKKGRTASVA